MWKLSNIVEQARIIISQKYQKSGSEKNSILRSLEPSNCQQLCLIIWNSPNWNFYKIFPVNVCTWKFIHTITIASTIIELRTYNSRPTKPRYRSTITFTKTPLIKYIRNTIHRALDNASLPYCIRPKLKAKTSSNHHKMYEHELASRTNVFTEDSRTLPRRPFHYRRRRTAFVVSNRLQSPGLSFPERCIRVEIPPQSPGFETRSDWGTSLFNQR